MRQDVPLSTDDVASNFEDALCSVSRQETRTTERLKDFTPVGMWMHSSPQKSRLVIFWCQRKQTPQNQYKSTYTVSTMTRRDAATHGGGSNIAALPPPPQSPNNQSHQRRGRSRRKRRSINSRSDNDGKEEPFIVTFFKVGGTLLLLSTACYAVF